MWAGALPALAQSAPLADFPQLDAGRDWPWWRGPQRNGVAADTPVPTRLSPSENVRWQAAVPGRGHSSPIVVGERVYLTTADERQQVQSVLAYDRATGRQVWKTDVNRGGFPAKNHPKNTEATPSVACDGERLYVVFFHHQQIELATLDLQGQPVWKKIVGPYNPQRYEYGYAPSPLLHRDVVIVSAEYEGGSVLAAWQRSSGKEAWRTPRPGNYSFSSPVVADVGGREQLLISGAERVSSFDPATGKRLWETPGTTFATCGTMVWDGDIVFASGGYPKAETLAVKADGSRVLWRNNKKCYEQSMLAVDGYLYGLTDDGILYCWRGNDGQEMWKQRLKGPVSASPVLAGGNIYWANELGTLYVFRPNPQKFDPVAENQIEVESFASPAVAGGQLFLRVASGSGAGRKETLYCFTIGGK
jgi:hypothetical protein